MRAAPRPIALELARRARQARRATLAGAADRDPGAATSTSISDRYVNRARRVIVALPPVLAGRIDYEPALPALRDGLTQRLPQGQLLKVQAIYERAFWRGDGLNGFSISLVGPWSVTFDSSPQSGIPGALLGFVGGDEAPRFARLPRASAGGDARLVLAGLRRAGADRRSTTSNGLAGAAVLARRPDRDPSARRADDLRPSPCVSRSSAPLGRLGDRDLLERLHGRRDQRGRARGARGARGACRRACARQVAARCGKRGAGGPSNLIAWRREHGGGVAREA